MGKTWKHVVIRQFFLKNVIFSEFFREIRNPNVFLFKKDMSEDMHEREFSWPIFVMEGLWIFKTRLLKLLMDRRQ